MPNYVNKEIIAIKLNGRLNIDNSGTAFFPAEPVEDTLIDSVIEEKESYVDLILGQLYNLPFSNPQPVVNSMVENLVMADLLEYNYISTTTSATDLNNLAFSLKRKAFNVLLQLTVGTNVVIPEAEGYLSYVGLPSPRRLVLAGETETTNNLPGRQLVWRDVLVGSYQETIDTNFINEEDFSNNPFSDEWKGDNLL